VRADRGETRRRGARWFDFTSDPGAGSRAGSWAPRAPEPRWVEPTRPTAPELQGALRHFAKPSAAAESHIAIPGLATRFDRIPVMREAWVDFQMASPRGLLSDFARLLSTPADGAVVVAPRVSAQIAAANVPLSALPYTARVDINRPFPASINTPVARDSNAALAPAGWRVALAEAAGGFGEVMRNASGAVVAVSARGLARADTMLHRYRAARPSTKAMWNARDKMAGGLAQRLDPVSRYVQERRDGLRVSGLVAVLAILVALGAYGGGALLVALTGTTATAGKASGGTTAQVAIADPAPQPPSSAAPSTNEPPADPAGRAAFYMTRAKTGDAVAQYDVGVLYARGEGLVQDYASAATWFRAAAAQGNAAAQYNLGVLYAGGLGVAANQTEALNWYRSAAEQNHPGAQFNLALAYAQGAGTKPDFGAAARWYRRAADQGLVSAMFNLAILYEHGSGVDRSLVDAFAWYSVAGDHGEDAAKKRAEELHRALNDKDKARADALATTIGAGLDGVSPPAATPKAPPA
jgi:hypothetical protein